MKVDADHNGCVSAPELTSWLAGNAVAALRREASAEFQDVDGDEDGAVTREELQEQGYMGGQGQGQGLQRSAEEDALFAAADADGSGTLSEAEFFSFLYPHVSCRTLAFPLPVTFSTLSPGFPFCVQFGSVPEGGVDSIETGTCWLCQCMGIYANMYGCLLPGG